MWMIRTLLRSLQAACCLAALITVSLGFVTTPYQGYASILGSSPVTYMQLITYTGFLYALFMLLFIELGGWFARPFWLFEVVSDFLQAVMLLVAAIVLLVSDYVQYCGVYGVMLRCRSLDSAVVFSFISTGLFLVSMLLLICWHRQYFHVTMATTRGSGGTETVSSGHQQFQASVTPTTRLMACN
jgi:hypothetical protein